MKKPDEYTTIQTKLLYAIRQLKSEFEPYLRPWLAGRCVVLLDKLPLSTVWYTAILSGGTPSSRDQGSLDDGLLSKRSREERDCLSQSTLDKICSRRQEVGTPPGAGEAGRIGTMIGMPS